MAKKTLFVLTVAASPAIIFMWYIVRMAMQAGL